MQACSLCIIAVTIQEGGVSDNKFGSKVLQQTVLFCDVSAAKANVVET